MNKATVIIVLVVVAALGVWAYMSSGSPEKAPGTESVESPGEQGGAETSLGMYAEENALVPTDQRPGNYVKINRALLAQAGYIVVHEDGGGKPGAILGASLFHDAGEHTGVEVKVTRPTKSGETLYVMIHAEKNGNMNFEAASDTVVQSALGGPIMATLKIDANADVGVEVMP